MREIKFYKSKSGKCPVEGFIDTLSSKQSQKVTWVLQLIEELPSVPSKYLKKLVNTDDIWEVRIVMATDTFRLLGFFDGSPSHSLESCISKEVTKNASTSYKNSRETETRLFQ